jgi:DNA-binding HxlR family transcriptional regulator
MRSYGQFCPVAKAAEVFAERWTPLVLRELFCGSVRFNELRRGLPLMSPTLLSRRLKELEQADIVERTRGEGRTSEYHLTAAGRELLPLIKVLGVWGKRWTRARIENRELDAGLLMWDVHRSLELQRFPRQRTVIRFELQGTASGKRLWWLMVDRGDVELCLLDPGFLVDLHVRTPLRVFTEVWLGDRDFEETLRSREIELDGAPELARIFPRLFRLSPLTKVERQVPAATSERSRRR